MHSENAKMKVFHVAETIWGGCGTYLNEIVPMQIDALGAAHVKCLVPAQHVSHLSDVAPDVVETFHRPGRLAGLPRLAAAVVATVRRWQPDVIHAHSTFSGGVVRALSLVMPLPPIVYCPHGWVFEVEQSKMARRLTKAAERALSHRCERIVAISCAEQRQGQDAGIASGKIVVISNGIRSTAPAATAEWNDDRLKVLFVGRLDRQKGVDVLLDAVRDLGDSVGVRIVGEQVLTGQPSLAESNTLAHVEFLGWLGHAGVAAQLNAADVVVMPSRWEGFGLVAIEAMRAGKPVVASAVGGLIEIVVDGVTGRLVPAEDASALGAALSAFDRKSLNQMGDAGRVRFLQHYTSDKTNADLLRLYAEVVHRGQAIKTATTADAARRPG
jgi:glycosyltransferase involved in cell wall biosynthesis